MKRESPSATERQLALIEKLKQAKGLDVPTPQLTRYDASELIGKLLGKGKKQRRAERQAYYENHRNEEKLAAQINSWI